MKKYSISLFLFLLSCVTYFPPGQITRELDNAIGEAVKLPDSPRKNVIVNALKDAKKNAESQAVEIKEQKKELSKMDKIKEYANKWLGLRNTVLAIILIAILIFSGYIFFKISNKIPKIPLT